MPCLAGIPLKCIHEYFKGADFEHACVIAHAAPNHPSCALPTVLFIAVVTMVG